MLIIPGRRVKTLDREIEMLKMNKTIATLLAAKTQLTRSGSAPANSKKRRRARRRYSYAVSGDLSTKEYFGIMLWSLITTSLILQRIKLASYKKIFATSYFKNVSNIKECKLHVHELCRKKEKMQIMVLLIVQSNSAISFTVSYLLNIESMLLLYMEISRFSYAEFSDLIIYKDI